MHETCHELYQGGFEKTRVNKFITLKTNPNNRLPAGK